MSVEHLSDEELIKRSLYRGYESLLQGGAGCLMALVLGTVITIAGMTAIGIWTGFSWTIGPWWVEWLLYLVFGIVAIPVCLICAALIWATLHGCIVALRVNKYHAELRQRFLQPETRLLSKRTAEIASALDDEGWVLACDGKDRLLSWFSALVTCDAGMVTLEAWKDSSGLRLGLCDPRPYTSRVRVTLGDAEVGPLRDALTRLDTEGPFEPLPEMHWTDTMPFTLLVQRSKDHAMLEMEFDSESYRDQPNRPAPVLLAEALGRLADKHLPLHKDFEHDYPFFTGKFAAKPSNVAGGS